jgi:hypothetical protein
MLPHVTRTKGKTMKLVSPKFLFGSLTALALILAGTYSRSSAAEGADYNSSRSNKSHGVAIPDTGASGGALDNMSSSSAPAPAKGKLPANRKPGPGSAAGAAVGEEGVTDNLSNDEGAPTTRKTVVVPHVLEKSGRISSETEDPAASDGGEPSGMAINEKGLPGEKKPAKKSATK